MKVYNLKSQKSGNPVANQFRIFHNGEEYFQSYETIIGKIDDEGIIYLDENYWDYSHTTKKYLSVWLGESIPIVRQKIAASKYKLVNLNS